MLADVQPNQRLGDGLLVIAGSGAFDFPAATRTLPRPPINVHHRFAFCRSINFRARRAASSFNRPR
jgi:hypothetical protein